MDAQTNANPNVSAEPFARPYETDLKHGTNTCNERIDCFLNSILLLTCLLLDAEQRIASLCEVKSVLLIPTFSEILLGLRPLRLWY